MAVNPTLYRSMPLEMNWLIHGGGAAGPQPIFDYDDAQRTRRSARPHEAIVDLLSFQELLPQRRRQGKRTRLRRVVCAKTLPTIRGSRLRTSDRRDSSSRVVCQLLCQAWPLSYRMALRESASSVHGMKSRRLANRNCLMQHPS
jgi:hypothetical protein